MDAETTLLLYITLMFIVAGVCSIVLKKLRLPAIVGYLLAGFFLGPNIFPQVSVPESLVEIFSELGIVLLMFYIGLELNLRGLKKVASYAAIIVAIEMSAMVMIGYTIGILLDLSAPQSLFLGVTISCASTAVVLSVMKDNPHMDGNLSQAVTGILILEDIGLIIILAIAEPIMGIRSGSESVLGTLALIALFIGITVVVGLTVVPRMMDWVDRNFSGETLLLVAMGFGFCLALVASYLGLSVAIGAFLGGIIISQSVCSKGLCHQIEPMKELFMAVFFISIGMQLDPAVMWGGLPLALIIAAIFIIGKMFSVSIGCLAANFKTRSAFLVGTSLVAMGEFTFVVAKVALDGKVIDASLYSSVIGAAVVTMVTLPMVSKYAPKIFDTMVGLLPIRVFKALDRIENTRLEVRDKMAGSREVRSVVKKQLFYMFIDFVLIVVMLLAVNLLSFVNDAVANYSDDLNVVPSLLLLILSLVVILPAIAHMVKRLRIIAETLASTIGIDELQGTERRARAYKFFRNIGSAITFGMIVVMVFPMLPQVPGLPIPVFEIVLAGVVVMWLAWDTINSAYDRVSVALTRSLTDTEDK
ncbi:MAG: cation:proton antiporter [Methanomassiliicoccus sp.]|nr:cation:proton antiporter [Methanomassiliicoccus sp.]